MTILLLSLNELKHTTSILIVDDGGGIIDVGGVLDPDGHEFDFDFEDISDAQDY